jgi:hypothetical protein
LIRLKWFKCVDAASRRLASVHATLGTRCLLILGQAPSFFAKPSGAKTPDLGLTDIDKKVSKSMMAMWTQFARTGNPNVAGLIDWPAYESAKDQYLCIAEPLQVKSGFSKNGNSSMPIVLIAPPLS